MPPAVQLVLAVSLGRVPALGGVGLLVVEVVERLGWGVLLVDSRDGALLVSAGPLGGGVTAGKLLERVVLRVTHRVGSLIIHLLGWDEGWRGLCGD